MMIAKELDRLKELVVRMSMYVETAIKDAVNALVERDDDLARKVIEGDHVINEHDVLVDEECIRILALTQPHGKRPAFYNYGNEDYHRP